MQPCPAALCSAYFCGGEGAEKIRLYAGGGILPASVCEEEWMETERKLQTMKYVISKGGTDVFG